MRHLIVVTALLLLACRAVHAAAPALLPVPPAPAGGEVVLGDARRVLPTTAPASAPAPSIPLIGAASALPTHGRPMAVYTTMQAAASAGVNPLGPAASASASLAEPAHALLSVTDETWLGRLAALPLAFKGGALLLLGVLGFALWERRPR